MPANLCLRLIRRLSGESDAAPSAGLAGRLFARFRSDKSRLALLGLLIVGLMFAFSLPDPLFSSYYSPVLY
ncbi:MAG: hypothetical protein LBG26_04510, partial [Treponema sp.]|nr:hypothetical protein [Treponema sp.]